MKHDTTQIQARCITVGETANYLNYSISEVESLIESGHICAKFDSTLGVYKIDMECAKALKESAANLAGHGLSLHGEASTVTKGIDSLNIHDFCGDTGCLADNFDNTRESLSKNFNDSHLESMLDINCADGEIVPANEQITVWDRNNITQESVAKLLDNLEFTSDKLNNAMYKIGYLQATVGTLKEQLETTMSIGVIDDRTIELIKENDLLKAEVEKLSEYKVNSQTQLQNLQLRLEAITKSWWWSIVRLFTGG